MDTVETVLTIEFAGAPRKVEYTLYAVNKLRKLTGKSIFKGEFEDDSEEYMSAFFWAGLIQHDESFDGEIIDGKPSPELQAKLDRVQKAISMKHFPKLKRQFLEALTRATPKKEDSAAASEGEEKKAK